MTAPYLKFMCSIIVPTDFRALPAVLWMGFFFTFTMLTKHPTLAPSSAQAAIPLTIESFFFIPIPPFVFVYSMLHLLRIIRIIDKDIFTIF